MLVGGEGEILEYVGLGDGGDRVVLLLLQPVHRLLHPEHRVVVVAVVVGLPAELEAVAGWMQQRRRGVRANEKRRLVYERARDFGGRRRAFSRGGGGGGFSLERAFRVVYSTGRGGEF